MGIKVLPPDVNTSIGVFTAVGADIRFGMAAIRNVGENVVEGIVAARTQKGPFTSFEDFVRKVPITVCNKRTVESLIKAGAFDTLGATRFGLSQVHEVSPRCPRRREAPGGRGPGLALRRPRRGRRVLLRRPPADPGDRVGQAGAARLRAGEMLGLYVSDHPLLGIEHVLAGHADLPIAALMNDRDDPGRARA